MMHIPSMSALFVLLHVLVQIGLVVRVLLRPHREPASRIAWIVVIVSAPVAGIVAYLLLGEVNIGRRRVLQMRQVLSRMPRPSDAPGMDSDALMPDLSEERAHLFRVAESINGFEPCGGNHAKLMQDSNATIHSMVQDIDNATSHVHLIFYIWLIDNNGIKVADALKRAAARGVVCRAMADGLGSRDMIKSKVWKEMRESGVRLATALPIGNPLLRPLRGRIDLRNHRKILVIDNWITYCGSQNCADPEFRVKAKFAPWVDTMMRFEGPIARQNQHLFASDWMGHVPDDDLGELIREPIRTDTSGFTAIAFGTGPTVRYSAMPEMFETLMYGARRELVVTTPYYVPTDSMQEALCAAARRGVKTTIVFPARNDSWIVAAASRSYYADLLDAGVQIHEYVGGLLHAKTMTIDGEVMMVGSANMDRRSFELNYENNILLVDPEQTAVLRARQDEFIASSQAVARDTVEAWAMHVRLWNNAIAMLGPVL
jgi:cardiolipin synthase